MTERPLHEQHAKMFLGKAHRVLVWAEVVRYAMEPEEQFTIRQVQFALAPTVELTTTHNEIDMFAHLGMIEHRRRRKWGWPYVRVQSPYWAVVEAAVQASAELFPEVYGEAAQLTADQADQ